MILMLDTIRRQALGERLRMKMCVSAKSLGLGTTTDGILTATKPKVSASEQDNEDKMSTLVSRMSGEWVSRKRRIGVCAYATMSVTVSRVNHYQLNHVYSIESCVFM
jgi:hypothetical protein